MKEYDVTIVGLGPTGGTIANLFALNGFSVLILVTGSARRGLVIDIQSSRLSCFIHAKSKYFSIKVSFN